MKEIPFFFKSRDQSLFGIRHEPSTHPKPCAWVLCHPFAEEKLWAHRVFVNLARDLARIGYPVLRFDYRGYGDSDGCFEDSTVKAQVEDIHCAVKQIREHHPDIDHVGVMGLRYGATLAALAAGSDSGIRRLVMIDPVLDMGAYLQEILRINLTTQMVMFGKIQSNREELTTQILKGDKVNIDGYDLSKTFFEPASGINLLDNPINFDGDCLVLQIGRASQPLKKVLQKLVEAMPSAELRKVVEEPFWKEIKNFIPRSEGLTTSLFEWLGETV